MSDLKVRVAISADFFTAFASIPRQRQNKVVNFINKFRNNPTSPGINYEKILNAFDSNIRSVRIDETYRGIVLKPKSSNVYLLLWVDHHDDAYRWAVRKKCIINSQTGSIQVFDVEEINESTSFENGIRESEVLSNNSTVVEDQNINSKEHIFKDISDELLIKVGVPNEAIPIARKICSLSDLDKNINLLPPDAYEALYFLAEGYSVEEVLEEFAKKDQKEVDTQDFAAALSNINTKQKFIVLDGEDGQDELKEILSAPLEKWRVFLHPTQRKIVEKNFNGAVRVLGGAGTGKTVVAMHRAKWLAENMLNKSNEKILFTTFTRNLAEDIKSNLRKICTPEIMKKIDVVNIDAWVIDFLRKHNYNYKVVYGKELEDLWSRALTVASSDIQVPEEFYKEEWEKVVIPNDITTKGEYIKVARLGRGIRLDRKARLQVWKVFEEFRTLMNENSVRDADTAMMEARLLLKNYGNILPYKTVIVDESQDLGMQSFKLIRQIAGEEHPNDIFIVGDTHQRIYSNKVVLSKCGINIRGRSHRLKINYRTTEETRAWAFNLLNGIKFDDLDTGVEDNKGYKSLLHGPKPEVLNFKYIDEEVDYIGSKIKELNDNGIDLNSICLVARTDRQLESYRELLRDKMIKTYKIHRKEAEDRENKSIRVATMHRVKGLEFDYVFLAGVNDEVVPFKPLIESSSDNSVKKQRIIAERSLLYVAATRAKKEVFVSSYGNESEFLKS